MISILDKPDTPQQAVLAFLCIFVGGICTGAFIDRTWPLRIPTKAYVFVMMLVWLASWLRRWFV